MFKRMWRDQPAFIIMLGVALVWAAVVASIVVIDVMGR